VISLGTIFPAEMLELIISASLDPDFLRSARRRSPAERWAHPWFLERRVHCVPLPAPGPPRTNTTRNGSEEDGVVVDDDLDDLCWSNLT